MTKKQTEDLFNSLFVNELLEETKKETIENVVKKTLRHLSRSFEHFSLDCRDHNTIPPHTTKESHEFAKMISEALTKKLKQKFKI